MCTRFYVEPAPFERLITRAGALSLADDIAAQLGKAPAMSGEIRPTEAAAVMAMSRSGRMAVFPMIWGFSSGASKAPVVNCRLETADSKELWHDSWQRRRCIIPASRYFEWEHITAPDGKKRTGDKYLIQPKSGSATLLAGLYRFEVRDGLRVPVFAVITREACGGVRALHDRMPLIILESDAAAWISPDSDPRVIAARAITDVLAEKAPQAR